MSWTNVKLIFLREVRDQLRDRRTLFTIAVLPLVLYPLLGMSFLRIAQFTQEHPSRLRIVGTDALPAEPRLWNDGAFDPTLCPPGESRLLKLEVNGAAPSENSVDFLRDSAQRDIKNGAYDALVYFPPSFGQQLTRFRAAMQATAAGLPPPDGQSASEIAVPEPLIVINTANDRSRMAAQRVETVLRRWRDAIVQQNLRINNIPASATQPFRLKDLDVAEASGKRVAIWSKVLPFVVLIWALTGAFYPAIDLCAGEKERGTLETLLSSPAERSEIVGGKLLTIMVFSAGTAMLNVASMTLTATLFVRQLEQGTPLGLAERFGVPPLSALFWLLLALLPISTLFSAMSLAVASFARSSKEGQYYLMPLLLVTLPLMILPLLPSAELNLGTSLIPVTGAMLLLKSLIEGQYREALTFLPPVVGVTLCASLLAVRWAVDQFNNESVLFRESERWDLKLLIRHAVRDRGDTPSFGQAILVGMILLIAQFFLSISGGGSLQSWNAFAQSTLLGLVGMIAIPALVATAFLTRKPLTTLSLLSCHPAAIPAAALLAVAMHPLGMMLSAGIQRLYPMSEEVKGEVVKLTAVIGQAPHWLFVIALIGLTPAICEELAFRGFILAGLRNGRSKWIAIVFSSALFAAAHSVLQQSLGAFMLGLVLGFLAVQSGSLFPAIAFHLTYNSLSLMFSLKFPGWLSQQSWLGWFVRAAPEDSVAYRPTVFACGMIIACLLWWWFQRLPSRSGDSSRQPSVAA